MSQPNRFHVEEEIWYIESKEKVLFMSEHRLVQKGTASIPTQMNTGNQLTHHVSCCLQRVGQCSIGCANATIAYWSNKLRGNY